MVWMKLWDHARLIGPGTRLYSQGHTQEKIQFYTFMFFKFTGIITTKYFYIFPCSPCECLCISIQKCTACRLSAPQKWNYLCLRSNGCEVIVEGLNCYYFMIATYFQFLNEELTVSSHKNRLRTRNSYKKHFLTY